jgi:outer membrane receptor for monomeric catechols
MRKLGVEDLQDSAQVEHSIEYLRCKLDRVLLSDLATGSSLLSTPSWKEKKKKKEKKTHTRKCTWIDRYRLRSDTDTVIHHNYSHGFERYLVPTRGFLTFA